MNPKGMHVEVYRNADGYDCTNHGASSRVNRVLLIGVGVPEIFEATEDDVVLEVVQLGWFDPFLPHELDQVPDLRIRQIHRVVRVRVVERIDRPSRRMHYEIE